MRKNGIKVAALNVGLRGGRNYRAWIMKYEFRAVTSRLSPFIIQNSYFIIHHS